ncbi:MAG: hypothetical protein ACR2PZ_17475 [Pseudomonadales bacterium]
MTQRGIPDFALSSRLAYEYDAKCSNVDTLFTSSESFRKHGFHELTATSADARAHGAARILLEVTGCDRKLANDESTVEGALMISRRLSDAAYRLARRAM